MVAAPATAGPHAEQTVRERSAVLPSFRTIYNDYFDFVWTSARRLGVPVDAVDDVVQEIFVVVNARLGTVEQPASLRSWIYGVVRRTVSTYHRGRRTRGANESQPASLRSWIYGVVRRTVSTYHRGRRTRGANESHEPFEDGAGPMQPSPLDLAVLSDEIQLLWRLLEELGPLKREVFVLAELEEMTMPEIAEAIGVPLNTAYSRLRVAREEFNDALARHEALQKERPKR
jgi:RNA polymerase sigma-70 factor (ECF subfamily)